MAAALILVTGVSARAEGEESGAGRVDCRLQYSLKGWSVFYKTAKGQGTITCDDGQTVPVSIKVRGGGITFGKSEVVDGTGNFSKVRDIDELFGSYALAEALAGAGKSAQATAMTKGEVSLALAGTGKGVDLGVAFGKFTIKRN